MSQRPLVLALDVGGTKLAAGVVAPDGRILATGMVPAGPADGPDRMIERHLALARRLVIEAAVEWSAVELVGIGCGGPLDRVTGTVHEPVNLPGWIDYPIVRRVEDALGRPAVLENDATAALLGELWFGAARGRRDVAYFTISTGIGGGIALDGEVRRGAAGNAGEFGHQSVAWDGWPCACGRRGCVEAFASGTNIARRAREAVARKPGARLIELAGSADAITAAHVVAAVREGDPLAREVWDATTAVLGAGVANVVNLFNPELVVLGGGVTAAGNLLLEPVARSARTALPPAANAVEIVLAALGSNVGIVGAAAVALEAAGHRPPADLELATR
jgi:glucokinase